MILMVLLLAPKGKVLFIGPERGKTASSGISRFVSPHGSVRYVLRTKGKNVAALQVVVGQGAIVANIFTLPEFRNRGFARRLFEYARFEYPGLEHASESNRTPEGLAWIASLGKKRS